MFEFFKPKETKKDTPQKPNFEQLKAALPADLRDEFQKLSDDIEKIISANVDGRIIEDESLSDEERIIFKRHGDLQKLAMDSLQKK